MTLFVAAAFVALPVRHQSGNVEDSCRDSVTQVRADWLQGVSNSWPAGHFWPTIPTNLAYLFSIVLFIHSLIALMCAVILYNIYRFNKKNYVF